MDRYSDGAHLYSPQYPPRAEHDALSQYGSAIPIPFPTQQPWDGTAPDATLNGWNLDEELAHMLSTAPSPTPTPAPLPLDEPPRRSDRRRVREDPHLVVGGRPITHVTVLITVIAVCAAALLGWSISYTYAQLRAIAETVLPMRLAHWWPLTVYGPWFVAALSILRATMQRQPAPRSWGVLLAASAMAVALCVSHASRSLLAFVMLGVPPITAPVCFWELIGQVSAKYRIRKGAHAQRGSKT
ncbi:DUF2637 domain-containing protein [Streptomyces sp. NPDC046805]|uniref:DUF2637 domain-containing protein n=1 Tax=Streptomyces sp. NPDC046805 TaxID=3155134 RepID=UPI0033D482F5